MINNIITNLAEVIGGLVPTKKKEEAEMQSVTAEKNPEHVTNNSEKKNTCMELIQITERGITKTAPVPEVTAAEEEYAEYVMENIHSFIEAATEEEIRIGENQEINDEILAEIDAMMKKPEPKPLTEEEKRQKEIDERNDAFYQAYLAREEAKRHDPRYRQLKEQGAYVPTESAMRRYRNNKEMIDQLHGYDVEEREAELKRQEIENNTTRERTPEEMGLVEEEEHIPTQFEIWEQEQREYEKELYEEWLWLG